MSAKRRGRIISFAYTTPALVADRKHKTRRYWDDDYARTFHSEQECQAWNFSPRTKASRIAKGLPPPSFQRMIRLTAELYKQPVSEMTEADYEQEGFAYLAEQGIRIWGKEPRQFFEEWRQDGSKPWVLEFKLA